MKITALVENMEGACALPTAHGLSLYIETEKHCLMMDAGPSPLLTENAEKLGVDLSRAEMLFLSHGHYDHADGIPAFTALAPQAKIYLQRAALGEYYSTTTGTLRYIGADPQVKALPNLIPVDGEQELDDELFLFSGIRGRRLWPQSNRTLLKLAGGEMVQDDFLHEQCLVIRESGKRVLLSGCAHNGILNVLDRFREVLGGTPDAVVSGFHMMKKTGYTPEEISTIRETAEELKTLPTRFFTCHCTGLPAYDLMKEILGGQLAYLHCGDTIIL